MLNLKNTLDGYLKNIEVIGNTVQDANNLANIRSVGDKVEGQELYKIPVVSCGKNLVNSYFIKGNLTVGSVDTARGHLEFPIRVTKNTDMYVSLPNGYSGMICEVDFNNLEVSPLSAGYLPSHKFNTKESEFINIQIKKNDNTTIDFDTLNALPIQLEEGTQPTSYEPYQEQKLEILSPVQLEKVGDVADRIICKDGVWGVEKNVKDFVIPTNLTWSNYTSGLGDTLICASVSAIVPSDMSEIVRNAPNMAISNKYLVKRGNSVASLVEEGIYLRTDSKTLFIKGLKTTFTTYSDLGKSLEGSLLKYPTTQPQFIPLPHDQQVKLRTFVGQTNVFFNTEIAGQVKAQVPKSLGAVVNTHTEQIEMLHNALKSVLAGDMYSLATILYPEDFEQNDNTEQDIMVIPE